MIMSPSRNRRPRRSGIIRSRAAARCAAYAWWSRTSASRDSACVVTPMSLRGGCLVAVELVQRLLEPAGVGLLGPGQRREPVGDLLEAFFAGGLGEAGVHRRELVGLAGDCGGEVFLGGANRLAGGRVGGVEQVVEVAERVAGLTL